MIQAMHLFINRILTFGNFKSSQIPKRVFDELLTGFANRKNKDVILFPELLNKFGKSGGTLIVDETVNPKYGLKHITRKLKILNNGGFCKGYKVVLFLWSKAGLQIPVGFGFYHKESDSVCEITLSFISRLRNEFDIKPDMIVADGAYDVDKLIKRITDYGWRCVIRCRSTRVLSKIPIRKLIPRGFGDASGELKNKTKVKIFRRKNRYYTSNRMLMTMQEAVKHYTKRWKIEESFRFLKSCIGIKRCQQHGTISQEIFIWICLIAFAYFSYQGNITDKSMYKCFENVIFGYNDFDLSILKEIMAMN
ncbi:MAG: transposase [Candidatus Paceibacterota bacterium]|jgi:hypothetical protein